MRAWSSGGRARARTRAAAPGRPGRHSTAPSSNWTTQGRSPPARCGPPLSARWGGPQYQAHQRKQVEDHQAGTATSFNPRDCEAERASTRWGRSPCARSPAVFASKSDHVSRAMTTQNCPLIPRPQGGSLDLSSRQAGREAGPPGGKAADCRPSGASHSKSVHRPHCPTPSDLRSAKLAPTERPLAQTPAKRNSSACWHFRAGP